MKIRGATRTRSYQPANGTEGMAFDDAWCSRCARDAAWREDDTAEPCPILSSALFFKVGDAEYPGEWIEDDVPFDQDSNPRCTAFLAEDADLACRRAC